MPTTSFFRRASVGFLVLACAVALFQAPTPALAEDPAGEWVGQIPSGFKVRIRVAKADTGYRASWINGSGNAIELDQFSSDGTRFSFGASQQSLGYEGTWDERRQSWSGTLSLQGKHTLALRRAPVDELTRAKRRPMEDAIAATPRPYSEQEVRFDNPSAGTKLAGSLTLPKGAGPFPAVVLISGTGMNRRDQEVAGHRVFLVWADALARRGIAVLRYDKRGVGQSTGSYAGARTSDFASDAAAAVRFLRTLDSVDPKAVGLVGHSEGGVIAPILAANDPDIAFVAMVAGPAVRGDKLFVEQAAMTATAVGAPDKYVARRKRFDARLYAKIVAAPDEQTARREARLMADGALASGIIEKAEARDLPEVKASAWMREFLAYDPQKTLRKLTLPVLALYGSRDVQVPPHQNVRAARVALGENRRATVSEFLNGNHLLQTAVTGAPGEYGEIEEAIDPAALKLLVDWVVAHGKVSHTD